MEKAGLLGWYQSLNARIVDLVGDFAGDELFIIEGDSLLRECFSSRKLDLSTGFQLLHATYLVEQFLQKLQQRKCVFEIVFFAQNATTCIPAGVDSDLHDRYLLAREAIVEHLTSVALKSQNSLRVKRFQSIESESFEEYLVNSGVYLFMCHDGAYADEQQKSLPDSRDDDDDDTSSDSDSDSESENDNDEESDQDHESEHGSLEMKTKTHFRQIIHWLSSRGHNVALINSLEFRDTKVMAMVIEGSIDTSNPSSMQGPDTLSSETETHHPTEESSVVLQSRALLDKAIQEQPGLTQRQCLLVVTLGTILLENSTFTVPDTTTVAALILHLVLLEDVQLEDRTTNAPKSGDLAFLNIFLKAARDVISSEHWKETMETHKLPCDLFDLVDGRLFFQVQALVEEHGIIHVLTTRTRSQFNALASLVDRLCGTKFECAGVEKTERSTSKEEKPTQGQSTTSPGSQGFTEVLPFENAVFEHHLKPVHLSIDKSNFDTDTKASKRFTDQTHWHNSKPLNPKKAPPLTPKEVLRRQKMNQRFMAEMEKYAKSLSGSTIASQPETIVVGSSNNPPQKASSGKGKPSSGPKGKAQAASEAPTSRELASAAVQRKAAEGEQKQIARWSRKCHEFATISDPLNRFKNVQEYLSSLPKDSRLVLEPEILAYSIDALVQIILAEHKNNKDEKKINVLIGTHIWAIITRLVKLKQGISAGIVKYVEDVCQRLQLPVAHLPTQSNNSLSFKPSAVSKTADMTVGLSAVDFQFLHGGPLMERSMDSAPDSRTPDFEPDHWQRDVLDQIDAKKSAFVVAPTSAGKTFISFYAMRQVLKEDHDGILVYVAPTKALVNQIAAEVLARFSKNFPAKATSKSVWAIHTRDYRINNPMGCQILITVPHILQIMLLSPSNAKAWTPRLRRIIFDEIHCIGQAEDGVVWEQLLLLSPCPIIALSATVGNPEEFEDWLSRAQGTNGHDLKMIQHQHRYSDLRKYIYTPPQTFSFEGLSNPTGLSRLGLDEAEGMTFMHPVLSLVDRSRGIPTDFSLEPRDCWSLWKAMHALQTDQYPVDSSLDPSTLFSDTVIKKKHVIEWQEPLKNLLETWMKDPKSPFEELLRHLSQGKPSPASGPTQVPVKTPPRTRDAPSHQDNELLSTTLPLICSLHAQRALPALFFNYDRGACEDLAQQLLAQLREAEAKWKSENQAWKSKVERWTSWKRNQENGAKKVVKATKKKGEDAQMSRSDQMRESASMESSPLELFDPERPVERFSFADFTKLTPSEFAEYAKILRWRGISEWLIDALERGIGIHHAGMNRKYRQTCETLFRKGFLRVVVATGTLALGINMPCKTVVFSGDSIFLTALNFRQAAGRAGRRGFDVLGNVVFQHVPTPKIHRLITSRLPDLNGHFPLTASLVLRMLILQDGSGQAASAVKSINSILSNPRICLGGPEMKDTVLHYLRFSIEYLRRNHLIDRKGAPLNFAGCISHLYYTENSSFAFHALLDSGYLQELCKDIHTKPKRTLRTLMLVMAHVFGRTPLRVATLEAYRSAEKRASSVVVLPSLPSRAAQVLNEHNKKTLDIYTGYVSTFIEQHIQKRDDCLPYSKIKCGGETPATELGFSELGAIAPRITSPFHALSGHGDKWHSISDLCETVRSDVWLEASVVPFVNISKDSQPLNAYLYDFFKHGNVQQLEFANGIRRGDMWFMLNDFSMILATLTTSLENFLNPKDLADTDLLDIAGGGDVNEFNQEEKFLETEDKETPNVQSLVNRQQPASQPAAVQKTIRPRQSKVADSWEDAMDDAEEAAAAEESKPDPEEQRAQEMENDDQARKSLILVHRAFQTLKSEFDTKFQAMWA